MRKQGFPPGWDEKRVRRLLAHYETQTQEQTVAEDEARLARSAGTVMSIPRGLVPKVRDLIARRRLAAGDSMHRLPRRKRQRA